jgi:hypothetical protein
LKNHGKCLKLKNHGKLLKFKNHSFISICS